MNSRARDSKRAEPSHAMKEYVRVTALGVSFWTADTTWGLGIMSEWDGEELWGGVFALLWSEQSETKDKVEKKKKKEKKRKKKGEERKKVQSAEKKWHSRQTARTKKQLLHKRPTTTHP